MEKTTKKVNYVKGFYIRKNENDRQFFIDYDVDINVQQCLDWCNSVLARAKENRGFIKAQININTNDLGEKKYDLRENDYKKPTEEVTSSQFNPDR